MSIIIKTNPLLTYIQQAIEFINPDSQLIKDNNKYYYQNRIIDYATELFSKDSINLDILYNYHRPDVISSNDRATHYGVAIGTIIGTIVIKDKDYYYKVASVKTEIRKLVRVMSV